MTTIEQVEAAPAQRVARQPRRRRPKFKDTWWRHAVGILALLFALFPAAYIISASFSSDATLTVYVPAGITTQPKVQFFPAHNIYVPNLEAIRKAGASSLPAVAV